MKIVFLSLSLLLLFSACSSKKSGVSAYEYERSNAASEKSLNKLDRE